MAVYLSGVAVRPNSGPYRVPNKFDVHPGQKVSWTAAQPIADIAKEFDKHGVTVYVQGDDYHLRGGQDHTPWSKILGKVFACDVMYADAAKLEAWFLKVMQSNEDTSFIDYININNSQYDYTGTRAGNSGDHHLHISIKANAVNLRVSKFVTLLESFLSGKPISKPVPVVVKPAAKGVEQFMLVKLANSPKVYVTSFAFYSWIKTPEDLVKKQARLKEAGLDSSVHTVSSLDGLGPLVDVDLLK
jgi:hypothetical protein